MGNKPMFYPPEPLAIIFDLPRGYTLVKKGDVYITKNCRQKTHEARRTVFVVHDRKNQKVGIGVPQTIFDQVLTLCDQTAEARAKAVEKKDLALEKKTKTEIMRQFPDIRKDSVPGILKHTLEKHSGRVGRTREPLDKSVTLAVRAHIRHKHTDYDSMLGKGMDREEARRQIRVIVEEKVCAWGGKPWSSKSTKTKLSEKKKNLTAQAASCPKGIPKSRPVHRTKTMKSSRRRSLRIEQLQRIMDG